MINKLQKLCNQNIVKKMVKFKTLNTLSCIHRIIVDSNGLIVYAHDHQDINNLQTNTTFKLTYKNSLYGMYRKLKRYSITKEQALEKYPEFFL